MFPGSIKGAATSWGGSGINDLHGITASALPWVWLLHMEMSLSLSTARRTKAGKTWWHRLLGFLPPSNWNQLGQLASVPANTTGLNVGWANIFGGQVIPQMEFPRAFRNPKWPQAVKIPRSLWSLSCLSGSFHPLLYPAGGCRTKTALAPHSPGYSLQPTCCHLAGKTFIYLFFPSICWLCSLCVLWSSSGAPSPAGPGA